MLVKENRRWPAIAAFGRVLVKFWLTGAQTVTALGMAGHDDHLRGAIHAAGYHGGGQAAARYYRRLAKEVDTVCEAGAALS